MPSRKSGRWSLRSKFEPTGRAHPCGCNQTVSRAGELRLAVWRRWAIGAKTILCVSDQEVVLRVRKLLLEYEGYRVLTAAGETAAEALLQAEAVDLVLLDYGVTEAQRIAAGLRRLHPALRMVLISFSPSFPPSLIGLVDGWVSKTRSPDFLLRKIEQLVGQQRQAARARPSRRKS